MIVAMMRIALRYGIPAGGLILLVAWMDWHQATRAWPASAYASAVGVVFTLLGVWLGHRLTPRPRPAFVLNIQAIASLAITTREHEVLVLLASGMPNKLIARRLAISPNTVKTHLARLYEKLETTNRTEAIARARTLSLLP